MVFALVVLALELVDVILDVGSGFLDSPMRFPDERNARALLDELAQWHEAAVLVVDHHLPVAVARVHLRHRVEALNLLQGGGGKGVLGAMHVAGAARDGEHCDHGEKGDDSVHEKLLLSLFLRDGFWPKAAGKLLGLVVNIFSLGLFVPKP
jgi:hypothetical protein